jgi:hypothetical protein
MSYRNQPQDVEAKPNAGARLPKGKDSSDCDDTIRPIPKSEPVRDAVEDKGAARRAVNRQIGETGIPVPKANAHED